MPDNLRTLVWSMLQYHIPRNVDHQTLEQARDISSQILTEHAKKPFFLQANTSALEQRFIKQRRLNDKRNNPQKQDVNDISFADWPDDDAP
jgi:hypothetical protein